MTIAVAALLLCLQWDRRIFFLFLFSLFMFLLPCRHLMSSASTTGAKTRSTDASFTAVHDTLCNRSHDMFQIHCAYERSVGGHD
jgi:hypothetical protein